MISPVRRRLIVLAARLVPLDRAAQLLGAVDGDEFAWVHRYLAAEPAAHLRRDDARAVFGHAGHGGIEEAQDMGVLRGVPKRQLARCLVVIRERCPGLHRVRDQPLLHDVLLEHHVGILERCIDVAARDTPVKRLVLRDVGVDLRCAVGGGVSRVRHGGLGLVVDLDQLERVVRLVGVLGDDDGDDIADVANRLLGDAGIGRDLQVGVGHEPCARHRLEGVCRVRPGVDGEDAGCARRTGCVDLPDRRVGMRAAQHRRMHHAGQGDVVGIGCGSGEQPGIFTAPDARAEQSGRHAISPPPPRPRGARLGRYFDTRCSGTGCPRGRAGSPRRSDSGFA